MSTKTKSNSKRALAASGLSLVLCFAMLLGTTFAWFSDSVSNKGNKITAGNLKIGFYAAENADGTLPPIGSTSQQKPIYSAWSDLKWYNKPVLELGREPEKIVQPGDSVTKYIAIRNEGSIPLKYYLDFAVDDGGLGDAVAFTFTEYKPNTGSPVTFLGSELEDQKINGSSATKGDFKIYKMELKFLESAGNTYQGGSFTVDLNLTATQDKDGARDALLKVKDATGFASATANSTVVLQKNIALTSGVTLTNCNIDLNGYTLDLRGETLKIENATDMVTADVEDGKIVNGKLVFNLPNGSASLSSVLEGVDCDVTVSSNTFVFSGKSNKPIVMNQGKIQVKGEDAQDIMIQVPSTATNVVVEDKRDKAVGNKLTVNVANGAKGVSVVNNPDTGANITVTGDGADDVTVVSPPVVGEPTGSWLDSIKEPESNGGTTFTIKTAEELAWVSKVAIGGQTFKGKTIELANDIDLAGKMWVPIGLEKDYDPNDHIDSIFRGTFNGNGHSVLNMTITTDGVGKDLGLFGAVDGATITGIKVTGKVTASGTLGMKSNGTPYAISGLCGSGEGYTIKRCISSVDIDASKVTSSLSEMIGIGGVIGENSQTGSKIENCMNEGNIQGPSVGTMAIVIGGIGGMTGQPEITNVLNTGKVSPEDDPKNGCLSGAITGLMYCNSTNFDKEGNKPSDRGLYSITGKNFASSEMFTADCVFVTAKDNINSLCNQSTYTTIDFPKFDFENVWIMGSNGYPVLR